MPRQSRGFWMCDFCQAPFHTPEDASFHENFSCHRRTAQHEEHYSEPATPTQHHGSPQMYSPPTGYRRYLVMGYDSGRLTRDDATACRNIEVFEIDTPNTTDAMGAPLALGTVGLRCIHCIGDPTAASGNAIFPRCVAEIGDCLRDIAEGHLWRCERSPPHVRQILEQALAVRRQAQQEQGRAWFQQENSRRLLLDYCHYMARELNLIDRYPINSGVMFPSPEMMQSPPRHRQQQQQQQQNIYAESEAATPAAAQHQHRRQPMAPHAAAASSTRSMRGASEPRQIPFLSSHDDPGGTPEPIPLAPVFHRSRTSSPADAAGAHPKESHIPYADVPVHFPFLCEPSGKWVCKFCQHVPVQYRDQHFQWSAANKQPPPGHFIDSHLSICRMYQQSLMQDYHGPPAAAHAGASLHYRQQQDSVGAGREYEQRSRDLTADTPLNRAMAFLDVNDLSANYADGSPVPDRFRLVVHDDRLLLTDYYYYLMKQLRHCRFAESDRRTRGGKRDTIEIGYGGLQCVHCAKLPNARKFFWGSVDRLANSFAEIPTHILKCRGCPKEMQEALLKLKEKHAEQMAKLPRGSQKVYFRRMWRRIHEEADPSQQHTRRTYHPVPSNSPPASSHARPPERLHPFTTQKLTLAMASSPGGGSVGSEESAVLMERNPSEAAMALVDSSIQLGPPSPSSRVLLAIPNDREWLSDIDIFIRQQVEVFCATTEDVAAAREGNKSPIEEGTVGIRCIHCAISKQQPTEHHTLYPFSIGGLYEAVQEFHRLHLDHCTNVTPAAAAKLASLKSLKGNSSLPSVGRNYYKIAAQSLGLYDTKSGIRASGNSVPIPPTFSFREHSRGSSNFDPPAGAQSSLTPRKRSQRDSSPFSEEEGKRQLSFAYETFGASAMGETAAAAAGTMLQEASESSSGDADQSRFATARHKKSEDDSAK
ncbi:hypothetical protein ACA910_000919 [Epithemia clementina (nom. ined.)]